MKMFYDFGARWSPSDVYTLFSMCIMSTKSMYAIHNNQYYRKRSDSVVECLTRDRGAAGSSLSGVTELWLLSETH